jgi:hypothetical protein
VRVDGEDVLLYLPPADALDELLSTELGCRLASSCATSAQAPVGCDVNGHGAVVAVLQKCS